MAGPLMHMVSIDGEASNIFETLSTGKGLASFWTADSEAEAEAGSIARFGFHGPRLEMKVEELKPGKLVRWSAQGGFDDWQGTTVTWEIKPAKAGGNEVWFNHAGWSKDLPAADLASVNYTWGQVVARLKMVVESGRPDPYFP